MEVETGAVPQPAVRDLADYVHQYRSLPFEPVQAAYRRRLVLARIRTRAPRRVLEVGCGEAPLFVDLPGVACTVVEPSAEFAAGARAAAHGRDDVVVVEELVEQVDPGTVGPPFDVVVVSCVLHEVPDPQALLRAAKGLCGPGGLVHVSVPSARSLHRLLAVAMGLIPELGTESETQRTMQQQRVYDAVGLEGELRRAGLTVVARGGIFVKPFTHAQMQHLLDQGFWTPELLDGLAALAETLPDLASEVWADAVPTTAGRPTGQREQERP